MGSYFKPWRRRIGLVTLVGACVFMSAWVRSYTLFDVVDFPIQRNGFVHSVSSLGWFTLEFCVNDDGFTRPTWWSHSNEDHHRPTVHWSSTFGSPFEVRWDRYGFGYGEYIDIDDGKAVKGVRAVPYWSVAIPLTLLSSWLLRQSKSQSSVQLPQDSYP